MTNNHMNLFCKMLQLSFCVLI